MSRGGLLAREAWAGGLLADAHIEGGRGLSGETRAVRIPPALSASPAGTMWLRDARGSLIRGTSSQWERVPVPVANLLGLVPSDDGGAILLAPRADGFDLVAIDARARERWRRGSHDLLGSSVTPESATPRLLQDERGRAYLHVRAPHATVFDVDSATGAVQAAVELRGYDASVLVWHGAVWRIQFDGVHRRWLRRPFHGPDEVVLGGGTLDDTFLTAIAVAPDGGPVLTDGRRILKIAPDGREVPIPWPDLPAPAGPPPAVLDVLRALPRPEGLWVVYADGAGWSVHALPVG